MSDTAIVYAVRQMTVYMPPSEKEVLTALAAREKRSVSGYLRRLVRREAEAHGLVPANTALVDTFRG